MFSHLAIYAIAILTTAGVIIRPFRIAEYAWAAAGALLLVITGLLSPVEAFKGIAKGTDVYLFLIGMMLLAEVARQEGLFNWLAFHAAKAAKGSPVRLFILIFLVGTVVTAFLSNDATAIVLTPAVAAAVRAVNVKKPLPYLYICAFIANAASFVLPVSNPANLVIYESHLPPLADWLRIFGLPSLLSVLVTFLALFITQKKHLGGSIDLQVPSQALSAGGKVALCGIIATTMLLTAVSAMNLQLGLPTAVAGALTACCVVLFLKKKPAAILRAVSWPVLLLVAGLFIIVEGLDKAGFITFLSGLLNTSALLDPGQTAWVSGTALAAGCNLVNNLPAGLIAGSAVAAAQPPELIRSCLLVGVDVGPNLSVTGSLATLLWLVELKREGIAVSAWQFLKLGAVVMIPALFAALAALYIG